MESLLPHSGYDKSLFRRRKIIQCMFFHLVLYFLKKQWQHLSGVYYCLQTIHFIEKCSLNDLIVHYEYRKSHEGLDSQVCRLHISKIFNPGQQHHVATLKNLLIASYGYEGQPLRVSGEWVAGELLTAEGWHLLTVLRMFPVGLDRGARLFQGSRYQPLKLQIPVHFESIEFGLFFYTLEILNICTSLESPKVHPKKG